MSGGFGGHHLEQDDSRTNGLIVSSYVFVHMSLLRHPTCKDSEERQNFPLSSASQITSSRNPVWRTHRVQGTGPYGPSRALYPPISILLRREDEEFGPGPARAGCRVSGSGLAWEAVSIGLVLSRKTSSTLIKIKPLHSISPKQPELPVRKQVCL